jgi:SAM-dependent methyltransferase
MDLETYRQTSLQNWGQMAPGWEDRREWILEITGQLNEWIADRVDPQPGQTILDIAAGTGDLGFIAARRVGDEGKVLSTDFSPDMVEAAKRNGEQQGMSNVEFRVMDAEKMDLEDDSVDGVVSRWSYMLMADPSAALKETRRVLRDGGTLAFVVWQTPDRNPWAAVPGMTLVQRELMPPPEPGAPGIFALGDRDYLTQVVTGAGFADPQIEELTFDWRYAGGDLWDTLTRLAGPLAAVIKEQSEADQQEIRAAIEEGLAQYRQNGEFVVPAACWGVVVS